MGGTIRDVPLTEGSAVNKGDVLVIMDTDTLPSRIAAARAEIAAAEELKPARKYAVTRRCLGLNE